VAKEGKVRESKKSDVVEEAKRPIPMLVTSRRSRKNPVPIQARRRSRSVGRLKSVPILAQEEES
jgi:hypothetical protein